MIKQVDRYIGKAALSGIAAVWVTMSMLIITFTFLGQLSHINASYRTLDALWYVALTLPRVAYQVFPVSALIGALIGVGGLAASNELVAFRTAGASRLRLAGAAMAGTLLATILVMVLGEWISPVAEQQGRAYRLGKVSGQAIVGGQRGMWFRDGDQVVNIQLPVLADGQSSQLVEFRDVVIYSFGETTELQSITSAEMAVHNGDSWTLSGATKLEIDPDRVHVISQETAAWDSRVKPELLDSAVTRPPYMSVRSLYTQSRFLGENGLDHRIYDVEFFAKIFLPFTVLALVLGGMPFVFGSARNQNMGVRIFVGLTIGVLFTIANGAAQNIGAAYGIHAMVSAVTPSLLIAVIALLALRRSV